MVLLCPGDMCAEASLIDKITNLALTTNTQQQTIKEKCVLCIDADANIPYFIEYNDNMFHARCCVSSHKYLN